MTIDNSKLLLEMFNFKKGLTLEQEEIERVVSFHLDLFRCDDLGRTVSQKAIVESLNEKLNKFSYDNSVGTILENVNGMIKGEELFYDLEDLYRTIENSNQGEIYRHAMQIVLDIINEGSERDKQVKILNELALYNYIPAVKKFLWKYTTNPQERANLTSDGGKVSAVYSVVEKTENGFLTFIGDKWFMLSESEIEPSTPSNHMNEVEKLNRMNLLEKALRLGYIDGDRISFEVEDGLTLGLSFADGSIYLNEEKCDKATTLESIFESPIVPFMRRDLYPVILETANNLDKFVELDIVQKVTNITNPFLECFAFNYKQDMYVYSMDKRYGNSFYKYESATMLVNEMNNQLGFDLSDFFKNKFSAEIQSKKELENKEKLVLTKISEINEGLNKLEMCGLLETSEVINEAYNELKSQKAELEVSLTKIKGKLANDNKKFVK
jgi:hypothetical protein